MCFIDVEEVEQLERGTKTYWTVIEKCPRRNYFLLSFSAISFVLKYRQMSEGLEHVITDDRVIFLPLRYPQEDSCRLWW